MKIEASLLPLQRLYHWEKARPNAIYMTQPMGDGTVRDFTWKEVAREVRSMAAYLQAQGYEPGARIAIVSKNCAHWIMSDLAIMMAGYVSVPLYPTLTADSVKQIMVHSGCVAAFIGKLDVWESMRGGMPSNVHCIAYPLSPKTDFPTWDDLVRKTEPMKSSPTRAAEELATIIYTSGTTGMPKGVMHSFGTLTWAISTANKRFQMDQNARMLSYLPLSHVAERMLEMGSFLTGGRIFFAESLETFAKDIRNARPTMFFSVPRLWVKFQQGVHAKMPREKLAVMLKIPVLRGVIRKKILQGLGLDDCRYAAGGAAPMPPELLRWYQRLGLDIIEVYGMTENCAISHSNVAGKTKPGSVGFPYSGVEQRIDSETGEVQMRSGGVMLGYYKEPEKTAETMTADGWLKTGDKGEIDAEGRLRITGRVKDLFKTSKGKYVAPAPIEDKLITFPSVEACCVAGANFGQPFGILMFTADELQKLASAPEAKQQMAARLQAHLDAVNAQLDDHEQLDFVAVVPDQWTVENGFVTPTMKVKRNIVEAAYGPFFEGWAKQKQPVVWHKL